MVPLRTKVAFILTALLFCGLLGYGGGPGRLLTALIVMEQESTATISADDKIYSPGDILTLTGYGFKPGEVVQMEYYYGNLTNPNKRLLDTHPVAADSNGGFTDQFTFPGDSKPGIYGIRASGNMGSLATTRVVDPPGAGLEGFQNLQNTWGGTLNATKSKYGENDVIPMRMRLSGLTAGQTVDVILKTDLQNTSVYLGDWFATMPTQTSNGQATNPCAGISCPGAVATAAYPGDDLAAPYALPSGTPERDQYKAQMNGQNVQVYGATAAPVFVPQNTSDSSNYVMCGSGTTGNYCIDNGSGIKKTVRFTFTASGTNAVILYSVHTALGTSAIYGAGKGASSFPGGSGKFYAGLAGDSDKQVGMSGAVVLGQTPTVVTVNGVPNPSGVNQSVTITSTVTGQQGTPSGTVAFWETSQTNCDSITSQNGILLGQGTLNNQGVTSINYTWASAGTKLVWACYSGDSENLPGGATYNQNVQASVPGMTVNAATGPYGGSTTTNLTATLSNSSISVANKTINFFLNGVAAGSAQTNGSGVATLASASSLVGINAGAFGSSVAQNDCAAVQGVCASFAGDGTLASAALSSTLTVTKIHLTVTAEDKSKAYDGAVFSPFTYTITGFVNGETDADLRNSGSLSGEAGISGNAATAVNAGTYTITPTVGTLAATNYDFPTFINGTLTISSTGITVTADAKSKTYGDADPGLTCQITSGSLVGSDSFSGALTRVAGENVGTYAINKGTLALSSNYTLTYVGANLTINARPVTVTADAKSKTYGDADPSLTYQITSGSLKSGDSFSGALTRDAGENVGSYAIEQGTLALNSNYALTYVGANLTINAEPITLTADAKSKTYGDADPSLTYQITNGSLQSGDTFSGALTRDAGENVGTYAITQGTLALSSNYALTYVGANLTINAKPITVTADAKSKTYGDADPALTYQITSGALVTGDSFSGSLTRAAGENVGSYAITQGTLALNSNYALTYTGANLTISAKAITVTADAKSKTFGDADPALTYQITSGALVTGDSFNGALSRDPGESVGPHAIIQGTLALNSNYALTYIGANLTINAKAVTVTADAKSKTYGDADPALTYQITSGALVPGDSFSGGLTRAAGESVGLYAINQGTLALSGNYSLTFIGANLMINGRAVTVTADAKSKAYGDVDPALTYQITSGSLNTGDSFSGALTRDPGENAGPHAINKGTLALNSNYALTYIGADLTIIAKNATVTANNQSKTYGSLMTPAGTEFTSSGFVNGDGVTSVSLSSSGYPPNAAFGSYPIVASNAVGTGLGNYNISYVDGTLTLSKKAASVKANNQSKPLGMTLTPAGTEFTPTGFVNGDGVTTVTLASTGYAASATVAGAPYTIDASNAVGSGLGNYTLTYNPGNLMITKKTPTLTGAIRVGNDENTDHTGQMIAGGSSIHDSSVLGNLASGVPATGTVTYTFYNNATCSSTPVSQNGGTVTIGANSVVPNSPSIILNEIGTFSYKAVYSGDGNYNSAETCQLATTEVPQSGSLVTSSELCTSDTMAGIPGKQFNWILTPDQSPVAYKGNGSNPGQFFYNIFELGGTSGTGPGSPINTTFKVPYPFVTQGARPFHVYSHVTIANNGGQKCFIPDGDDLGSKFTVTAKKADGTPMGLPWDLQTGYPAGSGQVEITVTGTMPPSGQIYMTLHLDFGLKGSSGWNKGVGAGCPASAGNDAYLINSSGVQTKQVCDETSFTFQANDALQLPNTSDTLKNNNVFKRDPGIAGLVQQGVAKNPVAAATLEIYDDQNNKIGTVITDPDGFYMFDYKYTGKASTWHVKLLATGESKDVPMKANTFQYVPFLIP